MQGITECILKPIYHSGHNFLTKLFRLISSLNSVEYEIGFRLEGFFFSVFFFIIHLSPKLNRLHLHSYGRWSSLFLYFTKARELSLRLIKIAVRMSIICQFYSHFKQMVQKSEMYILNSRKNIFDPEPFKVIYIKN